MQLGRQGFLFFAVSEVLPQVGFCRFVEGYFFLQAFVLLQALFKIPEFLAGQFAADVLFYDDVNVFHRE